jgi:hypothetical protein
MPLTTFPHGQHARPPSRVRTPRRLAGGVFQDAPHRPPRLLAHQRLPLTAADDFPAVGRQARDPRVQQDHPDAVPLPLRAAALGLLRRRQPEPGPLAHDPADRAPAQQSGARLRHGRAFGRVRGHVVLQVPGRSQAAGEPLAVDRRLLVRQLLPLGLALLLGLGHRDQDAGHEPTGVGAQVNGPVHLGESHDL